jgi:hypothetical protein
MMDIYDGAAWTDMDIKDLKTAIKQGSGIEEAAELLCRAGSVDDVARKAEELGLNQKRRTPATLNFLEPGLLADRLCGYFGGPPKAAMLFNPTHSSFSSCRSCSRAISG